jgi:hypothetical protein
MNNDTEVTKIIVKEIKVDCYQKIKKEMDTVKEELKEIEIR